MDRKDEPQNPSSFAVQGIHRGRITAFLPSLPFFSSPGDEDGAKRCDCSHCDGNVSPNELPVCLPNGVNRFDCAARIDTGNPNDCTHNGEDGKAQCRCQRDFLSPAYFDRPDQAARNEDDL